MIGWQANDDELTRTKRDSNPRSQSPIAQGLRLRLRGHWDCVCLLNVINWYYVSHALEKAGSNSARCNCDRVVMADALLVTSLKEPCRVSKRFTTKRIHELEHAKCEDGGQHIQYEVLCYVSAKHNLGINVPYKGCKSQPNTFLLLFYLFIVYLTKLFSK
jgi:hypothetical protein